MKLRSLPDSAEPATILSAARTDLDNCAAALRESLDSGAALPFEVLQTDFADATAPRLVVRIGDSRPVQITDAAITLAKNNNIEPLGLLACAVLVRPPSAADPGVDPAPLVLDGTWHPRRIGRTGDSGTEAQTALQSLFRQPAEAEGVVRSVVEGGQNVLLVGNHGSGRTALAAIVSNACRAAAYGVVWLNLADPGDSAESVVSTLMQSEKRDRYLVVIEGLQANLPIVDSLFSGLARLRHEYGLQIQVLATSWKSVADSLRPSAGGFRLRQVRVRAQPTITQMLDDEDIHGDDRASLRRLVGDDVHIAAAAIEMYTSLARVPTAEDLQESFTGNVQLPQERAALYDLACLGAFSLVLPEEEARTRYGTEVISHLLRRDLVQRTDGAVTIAPLRRAWLVMRYALDHWGQGREQNRPERIVWAHLQRSGRLIRATLSQIDHVVTPDSLRPESLYLLTTWEISEKVGNWLARKAERNPSFGDKLGAAVFAAMTLARLNRDEEWLSIASSVRRRWNYTDPDLKRPAPVGDPMSDRSDFHEIALDMAKDEKAYGEAGHPSGITADNLDQEKAYANWALGLLLCLEGTAPAQYRDSDRIDQLLRMADRAAEHDGCFYPARIPWVTARVVIGICHAAIDPESERSVVSACKWMLGLLAGPDQPDSWWRSGTGRWNSDEATTAMCLTALKAGGYEGRDSIATALAWLESRKTEWTVEGSEIDLAQVVETLAVCTDSPVHPHLKILLDRTYGELDKTPEVTRPEEGHRLPFLAAQLTEIVWRTVQAEFVRLLRDVLGSGPLNPRGDAAPGRESRALGLPGAAVRPAPPATGAPCGLTVNQLRRWEGATRQLSEKLTELISARSAPEPAMIPSVKALLTENYAQRDLYDELMDGFGAEASEATLRALDQLGRQVCGGSWRNLPYPETFCDEGGS